MADLTDRLVEEPGEPPLEATPPGPGAPAGHGDQPVDPGQVPASRRPVPGTRAAGRTLEVVGLSALTLAVAYRVLDLRRADLRVPFSYIGDAHFHAMVVKGIAENGWYQRNPRLGAPLGQVLHDFPLGGDNAHLLVIRLLTLVLPDWATVLNVFYLGTYVAVAVAAFAVLRHMGRSRPTAVAFAVLFAFLPYHLYRDEGHLLLSAYETVPLGALLLYWQFDRGPAGSPGGGGDASGRRPARRRTVAAVAIAVALGATSAYYAFFALLPLLALAVVLAVSGAGWRRAAAPAALGLLVLASLLVNLAPSILYARSHGRNAATARADPLATEYFGLKLAQVVLPVEGHRLPVLARLQERSVNPVMPSERAQAIGLVGSAGLVGLLMLSLARIGGLRPGGHDPVVPAFAFATVASIVAGTVGGASLLLALAGLTQLRSWNRISVCIAFYALAAAAAAADWIGRRARRRVPAWVAGPGGWAAVALLLAVGLFDQTTPRLLPDYAAFRSRFARDERFVDRIEGRLRPGASVFQLPYAPFPEGGAVNQMTDYDHLRGYLHSEQLRWSYGAMRGRPADWQRDLVDRPVPAVVARVAVAGFKGLWVNRSGYPHQGAELDPELAQVLGPPAFTAGDDLAFYDLRPTRGRLRRQFGGRAVQSGRVLALHPVELRFGPGFSFPEGSGQDRWRWTDGRARLVLVNPLPTSRVVLVRFRAQTAVEGSYRLDVRSPAGTSTAAISRMATAVVARLDLRPGPNRLDLVSDAPRLLTTTDSRDLRFLVAHLSVDDEVLDRMSRS